MDELFRFPSAVKHDPAIDAWLGALPGELRPLAEAWFARMRALGDDVREVVHDGWPTACVGDAAFAHVAAYRAHVSLYFFFGADLPDPTGLLEGRGKRGRHVKLRPGEDVDASALSRLVTAAYVDVKKRRGV